MADENISPNMNLPIPGVGLTLGPQWASDLNNCLTLIDQHTHTSGSGLPITPDGLDINADLEMAGNNLLTVRSVRLQLQSAALSNPSDITCLYATGVDLYYNDSLGNQVRITENGGVAGTPGSISNLTSPASASYVSGSSTFVWQSNTNTPAIMDSGYLILRNIVASSFGLTLTPPTLASNYTITLPALPASTKFLNIDASGTMGTYGVDNSTIEVSSSNLQVKDLGITTAKIAASAVTTAKIADANVTQAKRAALGQQLSSSSGSFSTGSGTFIDVTNLTVTITTTGRPVYIGLIGPGTTSVADVSVTGGGATVTSGLEIALLKASTIIYAAQLVSSVNVGSSNPVIAIPPSAFNYIDVPAAATITYKVQVRRTDGGGSAQVRNCKLIAYEL